MLSNTLEHVQAALAAIEADSPSFRTHVAALLASDLTGVVEGPSHAQPVISVALRHLLMELRKLRRTALWAYGEPRAALEVKDACSLDGIVCPVADPAAVPAPRGRECWLEIDAASALHVLPALPAGWGVVLRGLPSEPIGMLRRLSRLRPLGLHLTTTGPADTLPTPLDLLVLAPAVGHSETLSAIAPRRLLRVDSLADIVRFGHAHVQGILCAEPHCLRAALQLAMHGPEVVLRP